MKEKIKDFLMELFVAVYLFAIFFTFVMSFLFVDNYVFPCVCAGLLATIMLASFYCHREIACE